MASLQCEVELGLLWRQERRRRDWFPEWFTYTMSEGEKREWAAHVEQSPLRWTKENDFGEDEDHGPGARLEQQTQKPDNGKSPAKSRPDVEEDAVEEEEAASQEQQKETSEAESTPPSKPLLYINGEPVTLTTTATAKEKLEIKTSNDEGEASSQAGSQPQQQQQQPQQDTTVSSPSEPKPEPEPELPASPQKKCVVCSAPGKLCTGCKKVAYCGVEHQRSDWANHKATCKGKRKA